MLDSEMPLPTMWDRAYQARHGGKRSPAAAGRGLPLHRNAPGCSLSGALSSCPRPGANQRSVKVGYGSVGIMLLECHSRWSSVVASSGLWAGVVDYLQRSVNSSDGSSSDAIHWRCTSSACRLSSTCLRGSTTAWILVGNWA